MSDLSSSRGLPAAQARRLADLEDGPKLYDGRSIKWAEEIADTGFAEIEVSSDKKKTTIKAAITERGRVALERDRRGVDPYLVMTA